MYTCYTKMKNKFILNVNLSDGKSAISLQNRFMLFFGFKTCPASDLAPLHMLYNVSELAPLLQVDATFVV